MEQFFNDFDRKLIVVEEKLNILSEWHFAKGHKGAADIAEECMMTISNLWFEFDKLSKIYKQQEAAHEDFFNANVENLLGELKKYDDECAEMYNKKPDWLLFNYLNQVINENKLSNGITHETASTWTYLRSLVATDLRKRGLLK